MTQATTTLIHGGATRLSPTVSNVEDCQRYGCPATPWNWSSRWVIERAGLTGTQIACDLGAGDNPILRKALAAGTRRAYLVDNYLLPDAATLAPPLHRVEADMRCLPFENACMDVVLSVSVLEHMPADHRRKAMVEIARILKPGGRAVLTIGTLMRAGPEAQVMLRTLPFFTSRNCAAYLPLDLRDMLSATPSLKLAGADGRELCPGFDEYDPEAILADSNLVSDPYRNYPQIAAHEELAPIVVCETGIVLGKS